MKKLFYSLALFGLGLIFSESSHSQTVIYSEDFDGALTWSINTDLTAEGALPNQWYISCEEEGVGSGVCGAACGPGNQTLHVSTNVGALGDLGAAYFETGLGATTTNRRAESANISTVGFTTLTLNFDMIGFGGNAQDYCEVFYSTDGGTAWTSLATTLTSACCGGPCTGAEQGLWQTNTYALPAACEGIANLRISFVWKNNDDGVATDPSFAVDNIEITTPATAGPVASFTTPTTTICVGDCIDFTNTSTGGPFVSTDWVFTGATPAASAVSNPTNICYNTAGTYQVQLTVDNGAGTDTETQVGYITVVNAPNAGADAADDVCNNATLNLNTLLAGADPGGVWAETSGAPSGQFTAGTGVLDGNGLTVGNVYTFTYTVSASCGSDASTFTITVIDCSAGTPPTALFHTASAGVCAGECITFTDVSTPGDITNWAWDFGGGAVPNNFIGQDPGSVCFNTAGTYTVTLGVTNPFGVDSYSLDITVNANPTVTATANPSTTICAGDPVTLTGGGAVTYAWTGGVTDGTPFTPASTGTYTVTGTDGNSCEGTASVTISVITCVPMVAGFSYADNICVGDCITFTDTTTGNPISWTWDFDGGGTPGTSTDQNPVVCFNTAGTYDIQLTTTDVTGNTSSVTNQISVFDLPLVSAEMDSVIDIGGQAGLVAFSAASGSYLWTPDDGTIVNDTSSSTFAAPLVNTVYTVTFTDINGCQATDSVKIYVNFIEGLGVPQAFSPNGDNNNDILFVKGYGIELMNLKVFNRYGELVFETSDQNIGWDGKFKGRDENPGVFVWVLEYTFITGKSGVMSGNTTLFR